MPRGVKPSELLREAGVGGALSPIGVTPGAGCSQAPVGIGLAAAIYFFAYSRRCGQENVAMLLQRRLVEGLSMAESARLSRVSRSQGYEILAEFRVGATGFCKRQNIAYEVFCRA